MKLELGNMGRYGIRALIYLSRTESRTTAGVISEATGVPRRQLASVMARLSSAGLVESYEGRGGGAALARPAKDITLREAVEATEGPFEIRHCIMYQRVCGEGIPCAMHDAWSKGQETILEYLESQTLAEFITETVERAGHGSDALTPPQTSDSEP